MKPTLKLKSHHFNPVHIDVRDSKILRNGEHLCKYITDDFSRGQKISKAFFLAFPLPKKQMKCRQNSALASQGRIFCNILLIFGKWSFKKKLLKFTDRIFSAHFSPSGSQRAKL